jgi:hypothetical protein
MTVGQIVRWRSAFFATNFFLSIDRETLEAADRTPRGRGEGRRLICPSG